MDKFKKEIKDKTMYFGEYANKIPLYCTNFKKHNVFIAIDRGKKNYNLLQFDIIDLGQEELSDNIVQLLYDIEETIEKNEEK